MLDNSIWMFAIFQINHLKINSNNLLLNWYSTAKFLILLMAFNYPASQSLKSGTHFLIPHLLLLSKPGNLPSATLPSQPNLEKFDTSLHMNVYWQIKVLLHTGEWLCPLSRDDNGFPRSFSLCSLIVTRVCSLCA